MIDLVRHTQPVGPVNAESEYWLSSLDQFHFVEDWAIRTEQNMMYFEMQLVHRIDFRLKQQKFHQMQVEQTKI